MPEISKAILKSKTPIHFSADQKISDIQTHTNGRWSPIKITKYKPKKLFDVIKQMIYYIVFDRFLKMN